VHGAIIWGGDWNDIMNKIKYIVALDGRQSMHLYTTTNQKQSVATEGTTDGRRDEREVRGGAISFFFDGGSQLEVKT
jgi:hypothetical protein